MNKKKDNKIFERLPGDLRRMAALIGLDHTLMIVDEWGGSYVNIPKCEDLKRDIKIAEAQELYDAGGVTIRDLALRFSVTDRTMKTWLKLEAPEDVPGPLLELMNRKM